MARRFILVAIAAALAVAWPASASAAVAPTNAPVVTTPYVKPATLTWTPGANPVPQTQSVWRKTGDCTTTNDPGAAVASGLANTVKTYDDAPPVDGTYCYSIRATDVIDTKESHGVTVSIDTTNPTATLTVSPQVGGVVTGTVSVTGTSSDAVSGVASAAFHVGATGACVSGAVIGASWDTTTVPNGAYDVCNVVTDNAGHEQVTVLRVTVANPVPAPAATPVSTPPAGTVLSAPPAATPGAGGDTAAPKAPTKLTVVLPRAKMSTGTVRVTVRWVKPTASDLDRVVVVLNLKHAPRSPADGTKIYHGLGSSTAIRLAAGGTGYVALFAYDHSGNVSKPAQKVVSLAPLIPLRPFTGSTVTTAPRLTWTAQKATAYYNVQLFRNGTRVLTGWPTQAAFSIPSGKLKPGTYVWFVWPAVKHGTGTPTFGTLIGRATFVYKGL